jgi:hypothetical protein
VLPAVPPPIGHRFHNGRPLTNSRYDHLWNDSANDSPGSLLKASPPTGYATPPSPGSNATSDTGIARAYAGHTDNTGPATTTYIKASLQEVATALAAMTGQPHPLAQP